jgi:hypothetical protein
MVEQYPFSALWSVLVVGVGRFILIVVVGRGVATGTLVLQILISHSQFRYIILRVTWVKITDNTRGS